MDCSARGQAALRVRSLQSEPYCSAAAQWGARAIYTVRAQQSRGCAVERACDLYSQSRTVRAHARDRAGARGTVGPPNPPIKSEGAIQLTKIVPIWATGLTAQIHSRHPSGGARAKPGAARHENDRTQTRRGYREAAKPSRLVRGGSMSEPRTRAGRRRPDGLPRAVDSCDRERWAEGLSAEAATTITVALIVLARACLVQSEHAWRKRKAPMAVYHRSVAVGALRWARQVGVHVRTREELKGTREQQETRPQSDAPWRAVLHREMKARGRLRVRPKTSARGGAPARAVSLRRERHARGSPAISIRSHMQSSSNSGRA